MMVCGIATTLSGLSTADESGNTTRSAARGVKAAPVPVDRNAQLAKALDGYLAAHPAHVSVAMLDEADGTLVTYHAGERFETASIVKADILATMLVKAADAHRRLTAEEKRLSEAMITKSDNNAASTLWTKVGGASSIAAVNRRLGLTETSPNREAWGLSTTTAADQVRLIRNLLDPKSPVGSAGATYARSLLTSVTDSQTWGVSAAARDGETVAIKNGWDQRADDKGRWIANSIGQVSGSGHKLTIVVLSDGHTSFDGGVAIVEQIAKLAVAAPAP